MSGEIETTVAEILTPLLHTEGFELVAVETSGNRKNQILRLLIHKQGGLSISDCQAVNQAVRPVLEVHQILNVYKQLEIASPGVDRPLTTAPDFQRNVGRTVQIEVTLTQWTDVRSARTGEKCCRRVYSFRTRIGENRPH